jgi:hypothetical protein
MKTEKNKNVLKVKSIDTESYTQLSLKSSGLEYRYIGLSDARTSQ